MPNKNKKGGGQALDASRSPAFNFDPAELTLITDQADPLYDRRVEGCPVPRERVLDVALRGVHTPVQVRRRGTDNVVVAGKQRTKAALVCNALGAEIAYEGDVKAVKAAIKEMGADVEFVKRVTAFMGGKPIRIKAVAANSGDDLAARMLMRSENAQRLNDAKADRIRGVQLDHEKYAVPIEDIAVAEGVSVGTVKRWLKMDVTNGSAKAKVRGKATRPGLARLRKITGHDDFESLPEAAKRVLLWVTGAIGDQELTEEFPSMARVLGKTDSKEAA